LDNQELPPFVYQLLLLSTKGEKATILKGIVEHFNKLDKEDEKHSDTSKGKATTDHLRAVEGNVILHINFAAKQDQDLVKEFLKLLTEEYIRLTPFLLALLLSIARIQRFEDKV